jgi:putative hydrolase of the HAD superfamily
VADAAVRHVFVDIGGVLGSNGWDHLERARAAERFDLDPVEFQRRHDQVVGAWEEGRIDLSEYLGHAVFYRPRSFSRREFVEFMQQQSVASPDAIALVQRLHDAGRCLLFTLNNESAELNRYRLEQFGLRHLFVGFLSSCYLGIRKPDPLIYARALSIAQADPHRTLMIDARDGNLEPAAARGVRVHHFTSVSGLQAALSELRLLA